MHRERLSVVVVGHVDHGKTTLLGRLLADTESIPTDRASQIRGSSNPSNEIDYSHFADVLRDERAHGLTIATARTFLATRNRQFLVYDAPGHAELLGNMVTGASRADAGLLVVDAVEGMRESSRRHARILGLLGIDHVLVAVNKMDLIGYDREQYEKIVASCQRELSDMRLGASAYLPVAAKHGDNIVTLSEKTPWYLGPTLTELLDSIPVPLESSAKALRLPVQGVYRLHEPDRFIIAGIVEAGSLAEGDEIAIYPSGVRGQVAKLESFPRPRSPVANVGEHVGFSLVHQIPVQRGDVVARIEEPPSVTKLVKANLFWLGREPLLLGGRYELRLGTARTVATVSSIRNIFNLADLDETSSSSNMACNHAGEGELALESELAVDLPDKCLATSQFVILDSSHICGGGRVRETQHAAPIHSP